MFKLNSLRKNAFLALAMTAVMVAVGCGSDTGTTAAEEATFKDGKKPVVTIPPDANKPPANFKSSLDTGSAPGAPPPGQ
jgi:hypothetical protein